MTSGSEFQRLHATIEGAVQGVGFRAFVIDQARALGLTGWVRNTYNDQVEVTAEGPRPALEKLLDKLRTGPRMAFVSDVQQEWQPATGEFRSFDIRRTT
jgi:acylphosphatase